MSLIIDRTIGDRTYLNAGQLLFALPRPPGLTRVRARFRRLATTPGSWSAGPGGEGEETCRVTLQGESGPQLFRFITRPDLPLLRGGPEAPCEVIVRALCAGPVIPESAEADFEGALWSATIRLARLIGPPPGSGRVWLPVSVEGAPDLLDPSPRSGRISLRHTRDRMGVHLLRIWIDGRDLMEFGVVTANNG
jgi:hypothetical protein